MALFIGRCKCSLCPQKFMGGYVEPHITIVREIKQKEKGRRGRVAWHCNYHLSVKRLSIKNGGGILTR